MIGYNVLILTTLRAFIVVSSLEATMHPSSGLPPSHIPANAAMLLKVEKYTSEINRVSYAK